VVWGPNAASFREQTVVTDEVIKEQALGKRKKENRNKQKTKCPIMSLASEDMLASWALW
jgi:hypothetical protein